MADPGADRPDDRLAVCVPPRHRRSMAGDFASCRRPASRRDLRGRPPRQLRLLRLAGARPGVRPQRLRRGAPGQLGVGPPAGGRQRLGRRAAERLPRGRVRGRRPRLRGGLPGAGPLPREQPLLSRAYERLDLDRLRRQRHRQGSATRSSGRPAGRGPRTSDRALPRFTEQRDGVRRIVEQPPLITRVDRRQPSELARRPSTST